MTDTRAQSTAPAGEAEEATLTVEQLAYETWMSVSIILNHQ